MASLYDSPILVDQIERFKLTVAYRQVLIGTLTQLYVPKVYKIDRYSYCLLGSLRSVFGPVSYPPILMCTRCDSSYVTEQ